MRHQYLKLFTKVKFKTNVILYEYQRKIGKTQKGTCWDSFTDKGFAVA